MLGLRDARPSSDDRPLWSYVLPGPLPVDDGEGRVVARWGNVGGVEVFVELDVSRLLRWTAIQRKSPHFDDQAPRKVHLDHPGA